MLFVVNSFRWIFVVHSVFLCDGVSSHRHLPAHKPRLVWEVVNKPGHFRGFSWFLITGSFWQSHASLLMFLKEKWEEGFLLVLSASLSQKLGSLKQHKSKVVSELQWVVKKVWNVLICSPRWANGSLTKSREWVMIPSFLNSNVVDIRPFK